MLEGSSYSGNIDWNDILKKEARGINNEDLGEVQEVTQDYVLVEKGLINRVEVQLARDELYIETRAMANKNEQQAVDSSVQSDIPTQEEVVALFLRTEVPEVLKHNHIKEEIVVKKKTSTNTESISEELRSERVSIEGEDEQE